MKKIILFTILSIKSILGISQQDELENLLANDKKQNKEYARYAFKSSRVINGHSMEMLGKGVLDFRILHRFGTFKSGINNFFGLDQASMRMGFDYGITKDLTLGYGRSTFNKEYDGFIKYRIAHQHTGLKPIPISLVWVSGMTVNSTKVTDPRIKDFVYKLGYYHQLIIGRKFNEMFTLQLSPTFVHRNLVSFNTDYNNMLALGIGGRMKISNRTALIIDTYPILYGMNSYSNQIPLSVGVDIETGGHVFQLHITNATAMNEKAFIGETTQSWGRGEIQFGFNLSRVFTIVKNTDTSW